MTYATLLIHLQPGQRNTPLLAAARLFVDRFKAHVIGIAACQPLIVVSGDGTVCGDVFADDQRQIGLELAGAKAEFHEAMEGIGTSVEWRSEITLEVPTAYITHQARSADLIMTGSVPTDAFDLARAVDPGSLVMEAGRPVFIVPADSRPTELERVLIAWKDTPECRRATSDALPLLKKVGRATVLEIAPVDDLDAALVRVLDVVAWLKRHGVVARGRVERSHGKDLDELRKAAEDDDADVIVAGAYGHSRLREWATGGMTRDLLLECQRGVLVSH